jgi:hypothetical protein
MKILYSVIFIFYLFSTGFPQEKKEPLVLFLPLQYLDVQGLSNYNQIKHSDSILIKLLSGQSNFQISNSLSIPELEAYFPAVRGLKGPERDIILGTQTESQMVMSGVVFYYDEKIIIQIRMTDVFQKKIKFKDEVFTYDIKSEKGINIALNHLAERILKQMRDEPVDTYEETEIYLTENTNDTINSDTNKSGTNPVNLFTNTFQRLELISLASLGYAYPTGGELGVVQGAFIWQIPNWPVGIGIGSQLLKIYLNFPGYTNSTGTLLPIQLYTSIWVNPDLDKTTDLLLTTEWAWYHPGQSQTSNTNVNYFLQSPINYFDFRLNFFFTAFTSAFAGYTYYYDKGTYTFYIGATVYMGKYRKE